MQVDVGAFVMPNEEIDPDTPLTAFVVPLEALETVAGLKFFPDTLTAAKRQSVDAAARRWQQAGLLGVKVSGVDLRLDLSRVTVCWHVLQGL